MEETMAGPTGSMDWLYSQNIFGAPFNVFLGILIFWTIVCVMLYGANQSSATLSVLVSIFTSWLYGKIGWVLFVAPVIIPAALIIIVKVLSSQGNSAYYSTAPPPRPPINPGAFYQGPTPSTLYHGTTLQNAYEIYNTKLWLVGNSMPRGIYMTDDLNIAKIYAGINGGIVVISTNPNVTLEQRTQNVYVFPVSDANPNQEYYSIQGLTPTGILSPKGARIA